MASNTPLGGIDDWLRNNVFASEGTLRKFLSGLTGDGSSSDTAGAVDALPPPIKGKTAVAAPDKEPKIRALLKSLGQTPEQIDGFFLLGPKDQMSALKSMTMRAPKLVKAAKAPGPSPEEVKADFYAGYPQFAGKLDHIPPGNYTSRISSLLAAEERAAAKTTKVAGVSAASKRTVDRSLLPERYRAAGPGMTDSDVSSLIKKSLVESDSGIGGMKKGRSVKLKIVQDDAFVRSGLKSGDTVCIKIP